MIASTGNVAMQSAILSFHFETEPNTSVVLMQNNVCCAVCPLFREPLGASSDPAGSESLPALLHHCITKAKGEAANNNNNTTSARRTGVCPSQTQQQSQTPQEGEDLNLHRKRKRQNKKNPYLYLTSFLHRRQSEEDQTGILASADSEGPNYGTLR